MKIGDRVIHEEYGEGEVFGTLTYKGSKRDKTLMVVAFDMGLDRFLRTNELTLIRQPLSSTHEDCDELKRIKADMIEILNLTYQDGNNAKGKIQVIAKRWL